ncbi:urease accessory UreF family protein [Streptomyces sp. NPDC088194]|uniref:urease accessory protein UreF n=1 Tax=Streptomyces sp. NPDC088194 TaxID=3154931 RepID=UPI00344E1CBD
MMATESATGGCDGPDRSDGPVGADGPGARAALLLLADGRFPAGGHAHSGGVEAAVAEGRVRDAGTLADFCRGRLHTTGLVAAALAAAATAGADPLGLDEAADARTPSAALRAVSRRLGRQLLRAARAVWPAPALDELAAARPRGAHQPVVLGLAAAAAELRPADAAQAAAYDCVSTPAFAAVRLLGLDPFHAVRVLGRLGNEVDAVAGAAEEAARRALREGLGALPAASSPLLDLGAEAHVTWPVRLFAS